MMLVGFFLLLGNAGWIALGSFFLVIGLLTPAIAAWGERTRPETAIAPLTAESGGENAVPAHTT
jgi:hypothetical protein